MALHRKLWLLEHLRADVAVVPECAQDVPNQVKEKFSFVWRGHNPKKGLGVMGFNGWTVEAIDDGPQRPWVLPVRVSYDALPVLDVLAVWTVVHKDVSDLSYAAQVGELIDTWHGPLAAGTTAIAGDFNTSIQGPSSAPHRLNLDRLESIGMVSAYHHALGVDHGDEPDRTLRWIGPGKTEYRYNCDFVFVPKRLLNGVTAHVEPIWDGEHAGLSDHQPVVVDFGPV